MATESTGTKAQYAYWASAYGLAVALLYLWGYWSPFDVNILEYVSLSDVVKTAVYPIGSVFVFAAIGAVAGEVLFPTGFMPPGGGANTKAGRTLRKIGPLFLALYALSILLLLYLGPVRKWNILPVMVAVPVSLALKEAGILREILVSDRVRTVVLFLLAALPPFAYGRGAIRADEVKAGSSFTYVVSSIEGYPVDAGAKPFARPRYVGRAGDQYFLFMPAQRTLLVVPQGQVKLLELKQYEIAAYSPEPFRPSPAVSSSASSPVKRNN
jgi:hypothetical protein